MDEEDEEDELEGARLRTCFSRRRISAERTKKRRGQTLLAVEILDAGGRGHTRRRAVQGQGAPQTGIAWDGFGMETLVRTFSQGRHLVPL